MQATTSSQTNSSQGDSKQGHVAAPSQNAPSAAAVHAQEKTPSNAPVAAPTSVSQPSLPPGTTVKQPSEPGGAQAVAPTDGAVPNVHPKLALTLAGGGARGAVHVGVLKVLEANGIRPDYITGSSAGAVLGELYSAGVPVSRLEQICLDGELWKAFMPTGLHWAAAKSFVAFGAKRLVGKHPPMAIYSGASLEKFVAANLPTRCQNIENFPIHFTAIATNLLDTRPTWISKGNAARAARASCSVPFIYKPVCLNDKYLVDGGVRANLPTEAAAAAGAPVVVAVRCFATLQAQPASTYGHVFAYADRVMDLLLAEIEAKATADADVIVEPQLGEMPIYQFDRESMRKAIAAGEQAAWKMLPKIKERLQQTTGTAAGQPKPAM